MANYHIVTKSISRRSGKSCVASLAYRAASELVDQQTAERFDYTNKAFVEHVCILLPENGPAWAREISKACEDSKQAALQKLSDKLEAAEKRCDARVYREIEFSLPNELTAEQNQEWAKRFINDQCTSRGMLAVACFHMDMDTQTGEKKPHCHVLLSTRELTETGFSPLKQRDWNKQELLTEWREQYAVYQNTALQLHGFEARVDHRSYKDQGLTEIEPQPKLGTAAKQMQQPSEKRARFDAVRLKNQFQLVKNPELTLKIVTTKQATFTKHDIAKVLNRYIDDPQRYDALYQRLLNSSELIHLKDDIFTTRTMLQAEVSLVKTAESLAAKSTHKVAKTTINQVIATHNEKLKQHGGLSTDQDTAIRHMLGDSQISCVVGFAGAGKTTSLEAAKEAWEASGHKVLGLAPTGRAADNMAKCGIRPLTLHKFLWAHSQGREQISSHSVVVLDEAGMVDSRRFSELMACIEGSGAKLVSMGDGNQLQAVEAGPAFRLLTHRIQPAVLETVVRQKTDWQCEATSLFGAGDTRAALELYQKNGIFKIIEEKAPNPLKVIERYCLARQISGRIWQELGPEPTCHQDYPLYQQWRDLRQQMSRTIEDDLGAYKSQLERMGFVNQGNFDASLRAMSYENRVDTRADTRTALVEAWARDRAAQPEQTHLMLAFTNHDAACLNEAARGLMRAKGQITGKDLTYQTQRIESDDFGRETRICEDRSFAVGDRLLFTRNNNGLGVKNGTLGSVISLDRHQIVVQLDDSEKKVSFAPKLYPFFDHGWATTIHKAQGVTVDHVKKLASFEEYRNLAYVGMTRHRYTLQAFASSHDFWRAEKIIDRLSRVQDKLSGLDYVDSEKLYAQLKSDAQVLWYEKKIQQSRDFLNAVKVTAQSVLAQFFDRTPSVSTALPAVVKLPDHFEDRSEGQRSAELFKFRESIPAERTRFETTNASKFREVCEFFEFRERFGRAATPEDTPTLEIMSQQLTQLAGRIFEEKSLENGGIPKPMDICQAAYKAFSDRFIQENSLSDRLIAEHGVPRIAAEITAGVMLNSPNQCDPKAAAALAEIAAQRLKEIKGFSGEATGNATEQLPPSLSYRVAREMREIQTHITRDGIIPTQEKLQQIQATVKVEAQALETKIQQDRQTLTQREQQSQRQGMRV